MARGALLLLVSLFVGAPAAAVEETRLPSPSSAHKSSFEPEAHPAKWGWSEPLDGPASHGSFAFEPEAYQVKWYLRPPSPRRSSVIVKPEVKWDPPVSAGAGEPARGIHVEPGMLFLLCKKRSKKTLCFETQILECISKTYFQTFRFEMRLQ
jgi:hypothetical protein